MSIPRPARRPRRANRAVTATVGLLSAVLVASGCTAGGAANQAAGGEPQEGGDLTFLIDSLGNTWIPNNSSISSFQGHIWGHVTDKLVYVDENGEASPWIAESWENNEDVTEFTLHLKEGVTFSDGSPVDAAAVVANLDIWARGDAERGINPIGLFPKTYESAEATDDLTVTVTFNAPTLGFIPTLGYHGSILISPESLALPAEEQADLANDIGSGPFVVEEWTEGDSVVLTKREDYDWAPEALDHEGPAYLDSITYKVVAEPSLRTSAVQSDQAQVAYNPSPQELEFYGEQGFTVAAPRYLGFVNGYALNTAVAPFDDVRVRQALQIGIDRQEILDTVYTDDWLAAESFIQSNVPGATDHSDQLEFDQEGAEALLEEAGWVEGADGIRTRGGETLQLTLYPNPYLATSQSVDELVAQQLGRIGFDVDLQAYDVVTYSERIEIGSDAVPAYEITRSFIDAGTVAGILTDANAGENWFNVGQSDTTLNDLRTGISTATTIEERDPVLDELQGYVLEQAYFVPLTQIVQRLYLQSPALQGVTYNGIAYANYYTAWLAE